MTDTISAKKRSRNMSKIRSSDTKPEILVRSLLHRLGFRFRKNVKSLPGKPDIVLKKYKSIIFVHGCFWHQHKSCKRATMPSSNINYWKPKLENNVIRDQLHIKKLSSLGWAVLVVWECEIKSLKELKSKLKDFLSK